MSELKESCDVCPAHSGVEGKQQLIIWLLGIMIAITLSVGSYTTLSLNEIQKQVYIIPTQLKYLSDNDNEIKDSFKKLEERVNLLEHTIRNTK